MVSPVLGAWDHSSPRNWEVGQGLQSKWLLPQAVLVIDCRRPPQFANGMTNFAGRLTLQQHGADSRANPMIEIVTIDDSRILCRPLGDLDLHASISLRHAVSDILQPGLDLVIDLRRVTAIDAVALSALVGTTRRVRAVGGATELQNVSPRIHWLVQLARLDHLITGPMPGKARRRGCATEESVV